ncbi:MAG: hypothetical protein NUW24_17085 [Anaerolineae bacterium]|jgi:hypothetical protein|nr:hypothetical protein [Anaerolineae bacterium]
MGKRLFVTFAIAFLALLLVSFFAACGGSKQATMIPATAPETTVPPNPDSQGLLQARCTQCHDLGRVESARKTAEEWKATIERMVGKGAQLNQTEQELLIRYLAEKHPK